MWTENKLPLTPVLLPPSLPLTSHHRRLWDLLARVLVQVIGHLVAENVGGLGGVANKLTHLHVGQDLRVNDWGTPEAGSVYGSCCIRPQQWSY